LIGSILAALKAGYRPASVLTTMAISKEVPIISGVTTGE